MRFAPGRQRPSTTIPPPTPVPRITPNTTCAPAAAPSVASDRAKQFASFKDRKSTRLNFSHGYISYAVFCLKKKKKDKVLPIRHSDHSTSYSSVLHEYTES